MCTSILVLLFRRLSNSYIATSQFSLKYKRHHFDLIIQHITFGVTLNSLISKHYFDYWITGCFKVMFWAKVMFFLVNSDVTVNIGLINYTFRLTHVWQGITMFIAAVSIVCLIGLVFQNFVVVHISVRVHARHTTVGNLRIGLVKNIAQFIMWKKISKRFKNVWLTFAFIFRLTLC